MFCVITARTSPARSSSASAVCPAFGRAVEQAVDPRPVPPPDPVRVAPERVDRRHLERVDLGPDARRRAEVGDAALGRIPAPVRTTAGPRSRISARERRRGTHARIVGAVLSRRAWTGYRVRHDVRVRFAETDAQGIAHHASFVVWLEVARVAYLAGLRRRLQGDPRARASRR